MNNRYGIGKHTLGPIGDHLTHFLESLKAVTGSRWCVQSLSNVVRSRCYICSMPTKKYTFNKHIWTYYTTENKMTYITYAPIFEYLSYHHPESCIYIYHCRGYRPTIYMVMVDIENYRYTQNNAYTCGWPSPGHSGWKHSSGISAIYSGLLAAILKETSTSGY